MSRYWCRAGKTLRSLTRGLLPLIANRVGFELFSVTRLSENGINYDEHELKLLLPI